MSLDEIFNCIKTLGKYKKKVLKERMCQLHSYYKQNHEWTQRFLQIDKLMSATFAVNGRNVNCKVAINRLNDEWTL